MRFQNLNLLPGLTVFLLVLMAVDASAGVSVGALAEPLQLSRFFDHLTACQAQEFIKPDLLRILPNDNVSSDDLQDAASEVTRPTGSSQLYFSFNSRPNFARHAIILARWFEKRGVVEMSKSDIVGAAKSRFEKGLASSEIGECFSMITPGGPKYLFGSLENNVGISANAWREITNLFDGAAHQSLALSATEENLVRSEQMTLSEVLELRAIRRAVQIFEQSTLMANKMAGGALSDMAGEFTGGNQQNCEQQARTVRSFLDALVNNRSIKLFKFTQLALIYPQFRNIKNDPLQAGHVATRLPIPSTGRNVVIDTWFEAGAAAPHVIWLDEWKQLSLWQTNQFNDLVQ